MTQADRPDDAAVIAARKQTSDRQSVMAILGMVAITAFMTVHPGDLDRTIANLLPVLPWLLGLSALVVAINRGMLAFLARSAAGRVGKD